MKWIIVAMLTVHGHPAWVQDRSRMFPTAQACAPAAAALYAKLRHGPIVCQQIGHADLVDVYGNLRPID